MLGHTSPLGRATLLGSDQMLTKLNGSALDGIDRCKQPEGLQAAGGIRKGSSVMVSAAALFKAVVGAGIFAFPPAVRASGLVLGLCLAFAVGVISLFITWVTVEAVRELRRTGMNSDSDGRIG
mmetsp:Transcript_49612/g.82349  ORF Transcript_49612/g.82349 Transcript_49612/m.82349 type:complete len:123 (+) Transcript_49612:74-442(+)